MNFVSLCAGIGGFDLGFERAGMTCVAQVEKDPYCLAVLQKHWPHIPKFTEMKTFGRHSIDDPVELICGGIPCQPFSQASPYRKGADDDRNLWPEMLRIVKEFGPRWVVVENVDAMARVYLDTILSDLDATGYEAEACILPAAAFGMAQIRYRLFILGYADRQRCQAIDFQNQRHDQARGQEQGKGAWGWQLRRTDSQRVRAIPDSGDVRMVDGVPGRLDRYRVLGNAVVPTVTEHIGRMILAVDQEARD